MTGAPVRLGLVGCGRLAEVGYVPALALAPGVEVVAVADPDPARRALVGGLLRAPGHATVEDLLGASSPLDGVVVCAPAIHHEAAATSIAGAGLRGLVEKPPAPDAEGARRIAALDPAPWIAFNRRFDQGLALVAEVPADGRVDLRLALHYRRRSWRPLGEGDDALLDLGPHLVDLALFLTRAVPLGVQARLAPDRATFVVTTSRGEARIDCATDRVHRETVELRRPGGGLITRARRGGRRAALRGRLRRGPHPLARSLARQLEAYGRALRGEECAPLAVADEGVRAMLVVDAARRSHDEGGAAVPVLAAEAAAA